MSDLDDAASDVLEVLDLAADRYDVDVDVIADRVAERVNER